MVLCSANGALLKPHTAGIVGGLSLLKLYIELVELSLLKLYIELVELSLLKLYIELVELSLLGVIY